MIAGSGCQSYLSQFLWQSTSNDGFLTSYSKEWVHVLKARGVETQYPLVFNHTDIHTATISLWYCTHLHQCTSSSYYISNLLCKGTLAACMTRTRALSQVLPMAGTEKSLRGRWNKGSSVNCNCVVHPSIHRLSTAGLILKAMVPAGSPFQ